MKFIDPTAAYNHHPDVVRLAHNRSVAGLRANVLTARAAHEKSKIAHAVLRRLISQAADEAVPATEHFRPIAEVIDANESACHDRVCKLQMAVAYALTRETGRLHWFGWHKGTKYGDVTEITHGVADVSEVTP